MSYLSVKDIKKKLRDYKYGDMTARDVHALTGNFKSLKIQDIKPFVHANGTRENCVSLTGTIPVLIRGVTYNIPLTIWLRPNYPYVPPIVYVTPTRDMGIQPSQFVDKNGVVHLPYLNEWIVGTSDLSALCQIMCAMFIDHCPVYSKSAATRQLVRPPAIYSIRAPNPYGAKPPYPQYPPQQQQQYPGGVGAIDENPDSERMYYSQLFYRSHLSDPQKHEIHIIFVWNTELHLNHISRQYPEDSFLAGCHRVVELEGKEIEVVLDTMKWTKVMDGQWEIYPAQPKVTKAELDDFKPGRGIPSCVLKARPLCEDFPELLLEIILNGIKPPHHKVILCYMPSRITRAQPVVVDFTPDLSIDEFMSYLKREGLTNKDCEIMKANGIGAMMFATDFGDDDISSPELGFTFGGKKVLRRLLRDRSTQSGADGQVIEPIGKV